TVKYYAIVSGRQPGIYTDWATAESMVKGYPGAVFKSFRTRKEAELFLDNSTLNQKYVEPTPTRYSDIIPLTDRTIIYTNGSFDRGSCGFGIVIITTNGEKITAYGKVPLKSSNNVAELYAIY